MRLLFYQYAERVYHDNEGNMYVSGSFPNSVWERYLALCSELTVIFRDSGIILTKEEAMKTKQQIDLSRIQVVLLPDKYASIGTMLSKKIRNKIKEVQDEYASRCDKAIIRGVDTDMIRVLKAKKKKYLIELVGCPFDALWNHGFSGKILSVPVFLLAKYEVKHAPWVLYVTEKFLQKRYPTEGNACSCSDVALNEPNRIVLDNRKKRINEKSNNVILATIGAVNVRYKGHKYVIDAISQLRNSGVKYEYWIIGGGDSAYLKGVAKKYSVTENVKFLGQVSHDKVFEILQNIDIYIQPSLTEGLPRSVVEAMSLGLPVIASNVGGLPELIDKSCLFPAGCSKQIAKVISSMTMSKMCKMSQVNYAKAQEFDLKKLNDTRTLFYETFINE